MTRDTVGVTAPSFDGLARRGMLGLAFDPAAPACRIARIKPDGPAARAGLAPGDRLLAIDGTPVADATTARAALARTRAGANVTLTVARPDGAFTALLVPAPLPLEAEADYAVSYRSLDAGSFRLRAIVHHPAGDGPWPVVLFLAGSDTGSVERAAPDDPLRCLARDLVGAGYAVVRLERRGVGDSEGPPLADATLTDERDDYRAALRWLAAEAWCARGRVVLLGHSLGGLLAPQLCAAPEGDAVCAMMLYGVGSLPWVAYLARHLRAVGALQGLDATAIEARVARHQAMHARVLVEGRSVAEFLAAVPDARTHPGRYGLDDAGRIEGRAAAYWQEVAASPTVGPLCEAARPTLLAWGQCDWQSYRDEHEALAHTLDAARPGLAAFVEVPGADHNFALRTSREDAFARWGGGPYAPAVGEALTAWLRTLG